ncbi:MAG: glutamate racemase [Bacillota bacterium]
MKIALLDSGVGGLTVATEFIKLMPEQKYIYYGDTLHLPYGPRPLNQVKNFTMKIIDFLINKKEADIVVIACNTASAVALSLAKNNFSIPIYGTIGAASKKATLVSKNRKVGIIGTDGTVASGAYQKAIKEFDSSISVFATPCPKFVDFVEEGNIAGKKVINYAQNCLKDLKKAKVDSLILGCTHFPYLTDIIADVMGEDVKLINPAVELSVSVKNNIKSNLASDVKREKIEDIDKNNKIDFMVSDKNNISELLWNSKLLNNKLIKLNEVNIFS